MSEGTDERVQVPTDEAMEMLVVIEDYDPGNGPQPCVHTFRASAIGLLLGAHWPIGSVRSAFEEHGVELSGPTMAGMRHGLALIDETSPVFFETKA